MVGNSLDFFQDISERIEQIVFAYNINLNNFAYYNSAFERLFPASFEKSSPSDFYELVHPEDKNYVKDRFEEILKGAINKNLEFRIILPGNTEKWLSVTSFLLEKKNSINENIIVGFVEDITARKEHDHILEKYANKKNSILSIISHDLFGPLGSIKALSSIISKRASQYKDKDLNKLIGLIGTLSNQSIHLIKDLVNQEFLESAQVELVKERVDVVAKIREVIDLFRDLEPDIKKTVELSASSDEILLKVDSTKFIQVINNLLSNALKFTPEGGQIRIEIEEQDKDVLFKVIDNGIGIPKQHHANLFEKFSLARRRGLKGERTIGLGMSIVKSIIDWHKGNIWFESGENKGTTFFISIPKD